MLIPNKFSGYRAGVRLYPAGGGASGMLENANLTAAPAPAPIAPPAPPPPPPPPPNASQNTWGNSGLSFSSANQMVNNAYGQIGRASIGSNPNQIDQAGYNYWMNQLNSGAVNPNDFNTAFRNAAMKAQPETAARYQAQDLSQISGARPTATAPQFFQPVYQPQYQNYGMTNPFSISQYGQGGGYNPYVPQMQSPFNPYTNSFQTPFSYGGGYGGFPSLPGYDDGTMYAGGSPGFYSPGAFAQPSFAMPMPRTSSGPSQPIVSRSAQARGIPNVMMRRAQGGITDL